MTWPSAPNPLSTMKSVGKPQKPQSFFFGAFVLSLLAQHRYNAVSRIEEEGGDLPQHHRSGRQ